MYTVLCKKKQAEYQLHNEFPFKIKSKRSVRRSKIGDSRNSDAQWDCRRSECLYGKLHVTESREKVSYQLKYHCRWSLRCRSQSSQKRKHWRRGRMKLKEKIRASFSHLTSFFFSMSNLALQAEVTELRKKLKGIPFLTWYIEKENISWQKKRKELKMTNKIEKAVEQKCAEMKEGQNTLKNNSMIWQTLRETTRVTNERIHLDLWFSILATE